MARPRGNRPRVSDILVLIAAVGIGMAWARLKIRFQTDSQLNPMLLMRSENRYETAWLYADSFTPVVALLMVSGFVLTARLDPAKSPCRLRNPGLSACFGTTVVLFAELVRAFIVTVRVVVLHGFQLEFRNHYHRFIWWQSLVPAIVPTEIALVIVVCWLVRTPSGAWHPPACWVDRMGRVLGIFWIIWAAVGEIGPWEFLEGE